MLNQQLLSIGHMLKLQKVKIFSRNLKSWQIFCNSNFKEKSFEIWIFFSSRFNLKFYRVEFLIFEFLINTILLTFTFKVTESTVSHFFFFFFFPKRKKVSKIVILLTLKMQRVHSPPFGFWCHVLHLVHLEKWNKYK